MVALLQAGADPNFSNDAWSVLNDAVYEDSRPAEDTHFVELLLAAGADPNPPGYPPLFCAVNQEWSSGSVLRHLVAAGADIKAIGDWEQRTVLHRIAAIAGASLVDTALDLNAAIEARDRLGRTPLLAAADTHNTETLTRLIERGADITARDARDQSLNDLLEASSWLA